MVRAVVRATDFTLLLTIDLIVGLGWLLMGDHRTSGPFYDPAKAVLSFTGAPMRVWGAALVALAVVKYVGLRYDDRFLTWISLVLGLFWAWWFSVTLAYVVRGDGTLYGPGTAFLLVSRHLALFIQTNGRRLNHKRARQGR